MKFSFISNTSVASILLLVNNLVATSNAQTYCPTPDLATLESWASDVRQGVQNEGLPEIDTVCPTDSSRQKVLVIGVDGLRADAAAMLPLPNLRRMERIGSFSYWAEVQDTGSAVSGPGWASLFTGVEVSRHMVDGNSDVLDIAPKHPNVFKMVKDTFSKRVAASVTWHPLIEMIDHQDPTTLDGSVKARDDEDMVTAALEFINSGIYDVVFAAFDAVDAAGHSQGLFDGYKLSYIEGVRATDYRIGQLLDAVTARSQGEEWLIVLTTDHGGIEFSHGGADNYNRRVPFMVASNSPRVAMGRAPHDDPGSQMDVLPTVMHFFGGAAAVPADLDGQVFGFRDYQRTKKGECPGSDPGTCGCSEVNQADYRGDIATTISGRTCQRWDSQFPHDHSNTPEDRPLSGLDQNYCRNPDGEDVAWCYTTDPNERWEECSVPTCGGQTGACAGSNSTECGCAESKQADYRGTIATTVSGLECQPWTSQFPHVHNRTPQNYPSSDLVSNYCRNPDGEPSAWCYTKDENVRWQLCAVPTCRPP